ncbi:MAG TPA: pilus assembly protein PilP, partial [Polyangiaceae bacterium]
RVLFLAGAAIVIACGNSSSTATQAASSGAAPVARPSMGGTADAGSLRPAPVKGGEIVENEFTESDRARDPFRSFASMFVEDKSKQRTGPQIQVLLGQYSIDELKLVAIQTGGDYPRAQLVDPQSKGWTVKKGDYIGRPDIVHVGGQNGADYQLNWRVDRIRDGDVVLTREDPAQPMVPPATRVLPLHPEQQDQNTNQMAGVPN